MDCVQLTEDGKLEFDTTLFIKLDAVLCQIPTELLVAEIESRKKLGVGF